MRKSSLIFGLLIVFLFNSCYVVHRQTVKSFEHCYKNSKTEIENLININGYYEIERFFNDGQSENKNVRTQVFMFLDDGIYIEASSIDFFLNISKNEQWKNKGLDLGIYEIHNDTIIVEYIYISSSSSGCVTVKYKIIDSKTLNRIFYGNCLNPPKSFKDIASVSNANFIPYKNLPVADRLWIINKVWFWCNKTNYKQWKKQKI